ncbi:MAG: alpha/beta fold hydrolase [Streptosporangiaceae bacterium]
MRISRILTVVTVAVASLLPPSAHAAPAESRCSAISGAVCDTITVPLVRGRPVLGTTKVGYAVLPRRDRSRPSKGMVAVNPGGPGDSALAYADAYAGLYADLLTDHDLLLMDPRGVGDSSPVDCGITQITSRAGLLQAAEDCGRSLGARSRGYTSAEIADDLDAIRARLGVPRLQLLGQSYGTYLMTVYAQRHPRQVQSMVLSSAYPLDFDLWGRPNIRAVRRTLGLLCERSETRCDGPAVTADLEQLAGRLRHDPLPFTDQLGNPRLLDEALLAALVYGAAGDAGTTLGDFPRILREAVHGANDDLVATAVELDPYQLSEPGLSPFNVGQSFAVMCNDYPTEWSRQASFPVRRQQYDARRAALSERTFRPFSPAAWTSAPTDRGDVCIRWPDRAARPQHTGGPFPDVPVLVMSGELDPNTPTEEGRLAAAQFRRATVVEIPNAGHVAEREPSGCAANLQITFLRTGRPGDTRCLASIPPIPVT